MIPEGAEYLFVSDLHLGFGGDDNMLLQRRFADFLDSVPESVRTVYLLGDIFNFWVEYKSVVPRGFTRILAAFSRLVERGVEVVLVKGNHDWWGTDYMQRETGLKVVERQPLFVEHCGLKLCIAHGDGLGRLSFSERVIKAVFRNRLCITLLKALPTRWIAAFGNRWSASSHKRHKKHPFVFRGKDDRLYRFSNELGTTRKIDAYIYGHLHKAVELEVESGGVMYVLEDWMEEGRGDCLCLGPAGFSRIKTTVS